MKYNNTDLLLSLLASAIGLLVKVRQKVSLLWCLLFHKRSTYLDAYLFTYYFTHFRQMFPFYPPWIHLKNDREKKNIDLKWFKSWPCKWDIKCDCFLSQIEISCKSSTLYILINLRIEYSDFEASHFTLANVKV